MAENKSGYIESDEDIKKSSSKLTPKEREIILIMDDKDRKWKASCSSPTYMRKFEKQGWTCTKTEYYPDGTVCTKFYEAPSKSSISIGKAVRPTRAGREMTDEQKQKMLEGRKKLSQNNAN